MEREKRKSVTLYMRDYCRENRDVHNGNIRAAAMGLKNFEAAVLQRMYYIFGMELAKWGNLNIRGGV